MGICRWVPLVMLDKQNVDIGINYAKLGSTDEAVVDTPA